MRISLYLISLAFLLTSFSLTLAALLSPTWIIFQTPKSSPISLTTTYGLFQRCDWSSFSGDGKTCRKFPVRSRDCGGSGGRMGLGLMEGEGGDWQGVLRGEKMGLGLGLGVRKQRGMGVGKGKKSRGGDDEDDDDGDKWTFCDSFLTAGYLHQLSLIFSLTSILSTFITVLSGRVRRETGWKLIASLILLHALCVGATIGFVSQEFRRNDRFYFGSRFGQAFVMAATAVGLDLVVGVGLVAVGVWGVAGLGREDDYERIED